MDLLDFPILRNTYSGLRDAAPTAVEAAKALGMTEWQTLSWVRLPLAAPVIMAGVRTSAVITVGTATLAAFIGAGGLGVPIVSGLQLLTRQLFYLGHYQQQDWPWLSMEDLALSNDGFNRRALKPDGNTPFNRMSS